MKKRIGFLILAGLLVLAGGSARAEGLASVIIEPTVYTNAASGGYTTNSESVRITGLLKGVYCDKTDAQTTNTMTIAVKAKGGTEWPDTTVVSATGALATDTPYVPRQVAQGTDGTALAASNIVEYLIYRQYLTAEAFACTSGTNAITLKVYVIYEPK